MLILRNPQITGPLSMKQLLLSDYFDTGSAQTPAIGYYRPTVKLAYRVTYVLAGPNPHAFHLVDVMVHALTALVLAALIASLLGVWPAVLAASVFAVHPSNVEAVDIVTAQSDLWAALFCLTALWTFTRWNAARRPGWLVASLAATALALGAKESVFLLPVAVFGLALALGSPLRRALVSSSGHLAVWAAMFALRLLAVKAHPIPNALAAAPLWARVAAEFKVVAEYAPALLLGRPILFLPKIPTQPFEPAVIAGGLLVGAVVVGLAKTRLRSTAAFALGFGALVLAPALVLWDLHIPSWKDELPMADRWLYLPTAALAILFACALVRLRRPALQAALAIALTLALGALTLSRTEVYASPDSYFAFFVEEALPRDATLSPLDRYLLRLYSGYLLKKEGRLGDALHSLQAAQALAPWLPDAYKQLADVQLRVGDPAGAASTLERLLSPEFAEAPAGIAQRAAFENDTLTRMELAPLWALLGRARAAIGKWREAASAFTEAARRARSSGEAADALVDAGICLDKAGYHSSALGDWATAERLSPGSSRRAQAH